ncbi:SRPBCC family protein [Demequina pelophila]|uniref:SRPBCC family protein n=1 Tax=Demequina pelophila TaxID=1638984 RepID=UPI000782171F|nr:SRPBCC family protein [Demequina pelophila]
MTTNKHHHVIGIDAPPGKVYAYVADPSHLVAAMPASNKAHLVSVDRTDDGRVAGFSVEFKMLPGVKRTAVFTREEDVPGRRIVDHNSLGVVFDYGIAPEAGGATLTFDWDGPRMMKALDAAFSHSDRDLDAILEDYKRAIEATV